MKIRDKGVYLFISHADHQACDRGGSSENGLDFHTRESDNKRPSKRSYFFSLGRYYTDWLVRGGLITLKGVYNPMKGK
jgi:hypothetical protein